MKKIICSDCGKICIPNGCGTGYGRTETGEIICYDCCGKRDKKILQSVNYPPPKGSGLEKVIQKKFVISEF